jgi:glycosyltransferase involved in cell wall biosynthesis
MNTLMQYRVAKRGKSGIDTMKKIGIFVDCDGWGVYVFTKQLVRELSKLNLYEIHIITHEASSGSETSAVKELATIADEMHFIPRSQNYLDIVKNIHSILMHAKFDVFIPNYRQSTYAAAAKLSSSNTHTKVVGICHGNDSSSYGILSRYEQIIDTFVCISNVTYEVLKSSILRRADDIQYIPHGISVLQGSSRIFTGELLKIVYIGRLAETPKKVSYIFKLAAELRTRNIPVKFSIVGDGPDAERYKNTVGAMGLSDHVDFLGYKQWPDAMRIAQNCHMSILTSEHEGFCYGLAEAMGMGLPAVIFYCGGVVEQYLKDGVNGYVVPWGNVSLMADRIVELYNNPEKLRAFSAEARSVIAQHYGMKSFANNYAKLLDSTLHKRYPHRAWPRLRPIIAERNVGTKMLEKLGGIVGLW